MFARLKVKLETKMINLAPSEWSGVRYSVRKLTKAHLQVYQRHKASYRIQGIPVPIN